MANTTNGLPYPVGTDLVVNGDDAIKALAESIDLAVLPHGYARARCTTAASHGGGAWNIAQLDVMADTKGAQPWTLEPVNRRVKILKAGVYDLTAVLSATGVHAVGVAYSTDGTTWDRVAVTPVGTVSFTNTASTVRLLAADSFVCIMFYPTATSSTVVDQANQPSYLAIQALGGQ